jgi:hypothetical protein
VNSAAKAFVEQLNPIRLRYNPYVRSRTPAPPSLVGEIASLVLRHRDDDVTRTFVQDLEHTTNGVWDFSKTRSVSDAHNSQFIIGVFENPYNPALGFDCFICNDLRPDAGFCKKYPGKFSRVIEIIASTEGFQPNTCVAFFPEFYLTDRDVLRENQAFYFADRFGQRYERITRNILNNCIVESSLQLARSADINATHQACCVWLHMHEYCHRLGNMPLPEFLDMKTPRNAAAIEELRVDVLSIIYCYELAAEGHPSAALFAEVIFAERCFRYALQYDINENYDARGCAVLFNYMVRKGVIRADGDDKLTVDHDLLLPSLRALMCEIDALELAFKHKGRADHAQAKRQLVRENLHWSNAERKYNNHVYFDRVARSVDRLDLDFGYAG